MPPPKRGLLGKRGIAKGSFVTPGDIRRIDQDSNLSVMLEA